MANYNHARYLGESLGAIGAQTRAPDEVIIIDDGSTDESIGVIDSFASSRRAVRVLRNPQRLGVQQAIARALPLVASDYLIWTAADDRLLPNFLEKSMAALDRHPEAALCFSETTQLIGDTGRVLRFATDPALRRIFDLSDLPEFSLPEDLVARMQRAYLPIAANTAIVKREALLGLHGYPKELEWLADSFAYLVIALRHGACVVPETLALIRTLPGSYSQSMKDPARQSLVVRRMLNLLAGPEYRDIRRAFLACPSNLAPAGNRLFRTLIRTPRDWDLLLSFPWWKVKEHKLHHRLSWLGVLMSGVIHLPLALPHRYRRRLFPAALRRAYWRVRSWILS
jgi:hypothetical protein